jgi:tryptophan halogenase
MIRNVVVLGGGSAGFIAAIALKRKLPPLNVRVVRSADIGVIGVGEGTTQIFPKFFFEQLGLKPETFYAAVEPTWKLGIRFIWGPREYFHYSFSTPMASRWSTLPRNHGFYLEREFANADIWYSLMEHDRALPRDAAGKPDFSRHAHIAFHIENKKLVSFLDELAVSVGVEITDATVQSVETSERGVDALVLEDGSRIAADLFVDASGFRSELLGRALQVPYKSFDDALFCDRAVIGGWPRTRELIKPYTVAETMDAGWCWQIEHETFINRGYVYSSSFISDEDALAEFLRKNPQVANQPRVVKFRAGRYDTMWRGNVVGIGNSSGFVEPLEASALQVIVLQCRTLADALADSQFEPTASVTSLYNRAITSAWDDVRDFLSVHYKFNTRLNTPFWQACRSDISVGGAQDLVDFYVENGPSALGKSYLLSANSAYGLDGYLAMLIGQRVPHRKPQNISEPEMDRWRSYCREHAATAQAGLTVAEGLAAIRQPGWSWS